MAGKSSGPAHGAQKTKTSKKKPSSMTPKEFKSSFFTFDTQPSRPSAAFQDELSRTMSKAAPTSPTKMIDGDTQMLDAHPPSSSEDEEEKEEKGSPQAEEYIALGGDDSNAVPRVEPEARSRFDPIGTASQEEYPELNRQARRRITLEAAQRERVYKRLVRDGEFEEGTEEFNAEMEKRMLWWRTRTDEMKETRDINKERRLARKRARSRTKKDRELKGTDRMVHKKEVKEGLEMVKRKHNTRVKRKTKLKAIEQGGGGSE